MKRWLVLAALAACLFAGDARATEEAEMGREGRLAIDRGLAYLARCQLPDGSFPGKHGDTTGAVASCGMAFMAAGNLPGEGKYGKNVARCLNYLLNSAKPSGLILRGPARGNHVMYCHGLSTLCLAEAFGETQDSRVGGKLRLAVQLLAQSQADNGSWTYEPSGLPGDISITIMQVMALRAARDAGIAVPADTIRRAVRFVESCRSRTLDNGLYGYCYSGGGGEPVFSNTAAAVLSLQVCGEYKPATVKPGLDFLQFARKNGLDGKDWMYGHYYAAQAMYRAGLNPQFRQHWASWYPGIAAELVKSQARSGHDAGAFKVRGPGGVIGTAWSVMTLGIPYRYLPIYQR